MLAGILLTSGSLEQADGHSAVRSCRALCGPGGGLHIENGSLKQTAGSLTVEECDAGAYGGGLVVAQDASVETNLSIKDCRAVREGLRAFVLWLFGMRRKHTSCCIVR